MSEDGLGVPVHIRLLKAEIERLEAEIRRVEEIGASENRRIDGLRMAHICQDDERWTIHRQEHSRQEDALTTRFDQVNEFRGSLSDLSRDMATRREVETMATTNHTALETALNGLRTAGDNRARQTLAIIGLILTAIIVAVSLYATSHERPIMVQLPTTTPTTSVITPTGG